MRATPRLTSLRSATKRLRTLGAFAFACLGTWSATAQAQAAPPKVPPTLGTVGDLTQAPAGQAPKPKTPTKTPRLSTILTRVLTRDTGDLKYLREVLVYAPSGIDPMGSILDAEDTLVPRLEDVSIEALVVATDRTKSFVMLGTSSNPSDVPRTLHEGQRMGNFTLTRIERTGMTVLVRRNGRTITTEVPYLRDASTRR